MGSKIPMRSCAQCEFHRVYIDDIIVDADDGAVYNRINIMETNAKQATDISAFENLPDNVSKEDKELFLNNANDNLTKAKQLYAEWWKLMRQKYPGIDDYCKYDYTSNKFFRCVDKNNKPTLS